MRPDFTNHTTLHLLNCALKLVLIYRPHPVVVHGIQQLGYLNSNLMLRWDSPFNLELCLDMHETQEGSSPLI